MRAAILYGIYGSYGIARARAIAEHVDLIMLEGSKKSHNYAWDKGTSETIQINPEGLIKDLSVREVYSRIDELLSSKKLDVFFVPGYSLPWSLAAIKWCLDNKVKIVLMSESAERDSKRNIISEFIKASIVRLCDSAFVGGELHVDYLVKLGFPRNKILKGYNVVDNRHFSASSSAENNLKRNPIILANSRFIPKKNLNRLIESFAKSVDYIPKSWELHIIGDGELRKQLEELVKSNRLVNRVKFLGFLQYEQLPDKYSSASIFIHVSTSEQWGLVVNEAMAAELPCIVSEQVNSARELIHDGVNGVLVDAFSVKDISEAIIKLVGSEALRLDLSTNASRSIQGYDLNLHGANAYRAARIANTNNGHKPQLDQFLLRLMIIWRSISAGVS